MNEKRDFHINIYNYLIRSKGILVWVQIFKNSDFLSRKMWETFSKSVMPPEQGEDTFSFKLLI